MKTRIILVCLMLWNSIGLNASRMSFGDAISRKLIKYKVISTFNGIRRMQLKVFNHSKDDIEVDLEPGRIFVSDKDYVQPFVVTRPVAIRLDKGEDRTLMVNAVCGNSRFAGPSEGNTFTETKMIDLNARAVLNMMADEKIIDNQCYQSVVWHYTNKHNLANLAYYKSQPGMKKIYDKVLALENLSPTWYRLKYAPAASGDEMEFSGIPESVEGDLEFFNPSKENLQVQLTDKDGKLINTIEMMVDQPEGKQVIPIKLDLKAFKPGKYNIQVVNESNTIIKNWEMDLS